jgi:hypothetical protein
MIKIFSVYHLEKELQVFRDMKNLREALSERLHCMEIGVGGKGKALVIAKCHLGSLQSHL